MQRWRKLEYLFNELTDADIAQFLEDTEIVDFFKAKDVQLPVDRTDVERGLMFWEKKFLNDLIKLIQSLQWSSQTTIY